MKLYFCLLFLLIIGSTTSQVKFEENLNGFKLGQLRICPSNQFGAPFMKDRFEDGFEYEGFLLRPDTSLYMIFEYSKINLKLIWSIQIYGSNYDPDFLGLKLGMRETQVNEILGKPDSIVLIGEYGKRFEYNNRNYSIEISKKGVLSSLKIMDQPLFKPTPDLSKLPSLNPIFSILKNKNKNELSKILAPDIEIYKLDSIYSFRYSFQNELSSDKSSVYSTLFDASDDLESVNISDTLDYHESMRVSVGEDVMHVCKFGDRHKIRELVFKYQFGRYLIWEIPIRPN